MHVFLKIIMSNETRIVGFCREQREIGETEYNYLGQVIIKKEIIDQLFEKQIDHIKKKKIDSKDKQAYLYHG